MKNILLFLLLLSQIHSMSQSQNLQALLDSGKQEYKNQLPLPEPDYTRAYDILVQAVKMQPSNTEARYFLGYAIDKLNARYGSEMNKTRLDLSIQASEQFEYINKVEPIYKGEMSPLDPYSKISSIWGSLAFNYLNAGKVDSANWAFREGKKRGGYIEPILEINRLMLQGCNSNSILLSFGDVVTFALVYLQQIEHLRQDVTVIDLNLIHIEWYPKYLKNKRGLKLSYTDSEIDTLNYRLWEPTEITIPNTVQTKHPLKWIVKPTYGDYILKGDLILLDMLKQNFFYKEFYFPQQSDSSMNLFLQPYLVNEGLVNKLVSNTDSLETLVGVSKNFNAYSIENLKEDDIKKSPDAIRLLNNLRYAYLGVIRKLYFFGNKAKARQMASEAVEKFPEQKLPFATEEFESYFKQIISTVQE